MTRGAAVVVKLLCIEWLQGNVGETVAENASSVLEAKAKTCAWVCVQVILQLMRVYASASLSLSK